jgi:hypothetical protein
MTYRKARVTHLEKNWYWDTWHIRFSSDFESFQNVIDALKSYNCPGLTRAQWNPDLFGPRLGGWIVDYEVLRDCAHLFEGLLSKMTDIEQEEEEEETDVSADRVMLEMAYRARLDALHLRYDKRLITAM